MTPEGVVAGTVVVTDGKIQGLLGFESPVSARKMVEAGEAHVLPGLVDTHVHINEPGRTNWEGFASATAAAAGGGVTTLVDMPLNSSPVTTTVEALGSKAEAAEGACAVDYGFWGGVVPGNADQVNPLLDAGVMGFKTFLVDSGIDEFPASSVADLKEVLPLLAEARVPLLVHAELPGLIVQAERGLPLGDHSLYQRYLDSRPSGAEVGAVEMMAFLAADSGCQIHIVHVSSAEVGEVLMRARESDVALTAETCPHYLTFEAESIPNGATEYKCAPPIRDAVNRQLLWHMLENGLLGMVVTDHSPCPPGLKAFGRGDFVSAWGGIASLQLSLPAMWTEAAHRGHDLSDLTGWMCDAPARLAGLGGRKGRIAPGYDADMVVFDQDAQWSVVPDQLLHRHHHTPYAGRALRGQVLRTFVRGVEVYADGQLGAERLGCRLTRDRA